MKRFFFLTHFFFLFVPMIVSAQATGWDKGIDNMTKSGLPSNSVYSIIQSAFFWIITVLGFIAIIGFVISGIQYLTAAGDDSQIETAKTNMKYSVVGVIVALSGFLIVQAVDRWLSGLTNSF